MRSHPQALAQCRGYLAKHAFAAEPFYDTAGAARGLMFEDAHGVAVIASPLAARLYGLDIIAEDVADHAGNETRFVVVAREPRAGAADKGTLVLATEDRAGALVQALGAFAAPIGRSGALKTHLAHEPFGRGHHLDMAGGRPSRTSQDGRNRRLSRRSYNSLLQLRLS